MKILRILSLAAAALGLMALGACKSRGNDYTPAPTQPVQAPGSYYSGK